MSIEKPFSPEKPSEILDIETLSAQNKMRIISEIFDLGKDKARAEELKKRFLELTEQYYRASISATVRTIQGEDMRIKQKKIKDISDSDQRKSEIHNQIMDIITKMSLSQGLSKSQRDVVSWLADDRNRVADMIRSYYTHEQTGSAQSPMTSIRQARESSLFFSSPDAENK